MSEWPKLIFPGEGIVEIPDYEPVDKRAVSVIPADLGRELYEALNYLFSWDAQPTNLEPERWDKMTAALARYEREVGS
jgi:hypothetical protein